MGKEMTALGLTQGEDAITRRKAYLHEKETSKMVEEFGLSLKQRFGDCGRKAARAGRLLEIVVEVEPLQT